MNNFENILNPEEQQFATLVQSIKLSQIDNNNNQNNSLLLSEKQTIYDSISNEPFKLSYELIEPQNSSKFDKIKLLKIENTIFTQPDFYEYCIVIDFQNDQLKQKLNTHIKKYAFQIKFIDLTEISNPFDNTLSFSDSKIVKSFQEFETFLQENTFKARVIIFSQTFNTKFINILDNTPYKYFCQQIDNVQQEYLEVLPLHQQFQQLELTYKGIVSVIDSTISFLKELIYTQVFICLQVSNHMNKIHQPLLYQTNNKKKEDSQINNFVIPYMLSNRELYIPFPLDAKIKTIKDGIFKEPSKIQIRKSQSNLQLINQYQIVYQQLNQLHERLLFIKDEEQFYSITSNEQFYSVKTFINRSQSQDLLEQIQKAPTDSLIYLVFLNLQQIENDNKITNQQKFINFINFRQQILIGTLIQKIY